MATEASVLQFTLPNRRRWPRFQVDVPLRVVAQKLGKTYIAEGRGKDLNEGGMAVFVGVELSIGEQVAIEFTPAYSVGPVRVRCVVRNRRAYTYGVEFLLNTREDEARANQIRTLLKALHC